jgi:hypothetical protein
MAPWMERHIEARQPPGALFIASSAPFHIQEQYLQ